MEKIKFQSVDPAERLEMLQANCDNSEDLDYTKAFTDDEIRSMEVDLKEQLIEKAKLDEKLTEYKQEIKLKAEPVTRKIVILLEGLRFGSRIVTEKCFKFIEGTRAVYYNAEGEFVKERPLLPEERQRRLSFERNELRDASNF